VEDDDGCGKMVAVVFCFLKSFNSNPRLGSLGLHASGFTFVLVL
jgi:hypothetical protein